MWGRGEGERPKWEEENIGNGAAPKATPCLSSSENES